MNRKPWWSVTVAAVMAVSGCVVYEPVVVSPQSTVQQRFDRAWTAASGAMYDQGVAITVQDRAAGVRSEEHTSELQSHVNLVCRLLLEKKKKIPNNTILL